MFTFHRRTRSGSTDAPTSTSSGFWSALYRGVFAGGGEGSRNRSKSAPVTSGTSCFDGMRNRRNSSSDSGLSAGPSEETILPYDEDDAASLPKAWKAAGVDRCFGIELDVSPKCRLAAYTGAVPAVLVVLHGELVKQHGMVAEGVFRKSPDATVCATVKKSLAQGTFDGCDDVHVLASLTKSFFRDLPTKLYDLVGLTPAEMKDLLALTKNGQGEEAAFRQIRERIRTSPEPGQSTLLWLLNLLVDATQHASDNKMNAKNLATCMSPNLFFVDISTADPMQAMETARVVSDFTQALIQATAAGRRHDQQGAS